MDFFFWMVVFGGLSMIGGIAWCVFILSSVFSVSRSAEQNLNQLLPNLEQQLRQANYIKPVNMRASQQAQILQMIMQTQNQMHQLDDIHRMRYENRVGHLMGMAANVGIDWNPGNT